ncbi:MAG: leucine-rich repeat domain-containing protein [Prolixibacteraceae bacterium]
MKKHILKGVLMLLVTGILSSCSKYNPGDIVPSITNLEVSFNTSGGSELPKLIVPEEGGFVQQPFSPAKSGFAFETWCVDKELTKEFDFANVRIFENSSIYARYITDQANQDRFNFDVPTKTISTLKEPDFRKKMKNVVIPAKMGDVPVENLSAWGFYQDPALVSVLIPEGVKTIGDECFRQSKKLKVVYIGNSVTTIKGNVFEGCTELTTIHLPDGLKSLGGGNFANMKKVSHKLIIPSGVTDIPGYCFYQSEFAGGIELGNAVTTIQGNAFTDCAIQSIILPATLTSIGGGALARSARTIIVKGTDPAKIALAGYAFLNPLGVTIKVPKASLEAFRTNAKWAEYNVSPYQIVADE